MEKINILYTYTGGYETQIATSILSILENNTPQDVVFYAIIQKVSDEDKKKLTELVKRYGSTINFIDFGDTQDYFDFTIDTGGWHQIILARLFLGRLLPKEVKKVLYLDGDTMIRGKLNALFELDMDDKIIGMSIEPTAEPKSLERFGFKNQLYCNSGVMLINLKKFREEKCEEKILSFYKENFNGISGNDQDVINIVMKDEIKYLSPRYNFGVYYDAYPYKMFEKKLASAKYNEIITEKDYEESRKNPIIVHFLGEDRPWRNGNKNRFRDEYFTYKNLTPYKDTPNESGFETYFLFWNIFNAVMKPFPRMRLLIINSLIPTMMKIRKNKLEKEKKK